MQTFVVIAAKRGRTISEKSSQRLRHQQPVLPFDAALGTTWSNALGTVIVRAWCEPNDAFGLGQSWTDGRDGFTAFSGYVWPRTGGWQPRRSWADQLAEACRQQPVERLIESLAGAYTAVGLDADGSGVCFSDPLGIGLLYVGEGDDYTVVSSRADVAAWAMSETPARDPLGAAWLPYVGHVVGGQTGFAGVSTLASGRYVSVDPRVGATTRVWSEMPWHENADDMSPADHVDRARRDIAADLRTMLALPAERTVAGLTGGRDTRLILAVLLGEGLAGDVIFRTLGNETLPDVQVARTISEHFHLVHEWGPGRAASTPTPGGSSPSRAATYEERIRQQVRDSAGMLNIWDMGQRVGPASTLNLSGLCGEIMSTHFDQTMNVKSHKEAEHRFLNGWRFGDVGLLRKDVHAGMLAEARGELFDESAPGATPIELIDMFFLRNRLRRWTGTEQEIDQTNRVFPLYSLNAVRSAFSLGDRRRRAMYLHAMIIYTSCPELVTWPFAGPGWPDPAALPDIALRAPTRRSRIRKHARRLRRVVPVTTGGHAAQKSTTANQQHQARLFDETKRLFKACLADDPNNDVFEVIDRPRTLEAIENLERLDHQRRVRLYGAATAALWLGDRTPLASRTERPA